MNTYVLSTSQIPRRNFAIPHLPSNRPISWLRSGFDDLMAAPITGLLYGAAVAALAFLLVSLTVAINRFFFVPFIFGGFLTIGPILSVGLMAMAKRREKHPDRHPDEHSDEHPDRQREQQGAKEPADTVRRILAVNTSSLSLMGLFLLLVFINWIMLSNLLFGGVFHELMPTYAEVRPLPVLFGQSWPFALVYGGVALVMAVLVFRLTALSLPMLVDQRVDAFNAAFASWRAVGENWRPMSLWALLIAALTTVGILTYFVGLIIVTPILGYASWHAYRETLIPEGQTSER
ncbi:DUF2189 domain-containing protein [Halochromatium glycolicum]|uniref:DUF2189 domain-containing protein n=1 Tax=Halochromatium glycolicum TaxID=85075 RepID=A0AAJ0XAJ8_9GAMM|nr:DUF2189 domain-containing protein [Halochromatium glycolicum]MBK1705230.1 hypothetical protein [Halochromatium glycolicum]